MFFRRASKIDRYPIARGRGVGQGASGALECKKCRTVNGTEILQKLRINQEISDVNVSWSSEPQTNQPVMDFQLCESQF